MIPHEWLAAFYAEKYTAAPPAAIGAAEALLVAGVLEAIAENHEMWAEDGAEGIDPFSLPLNDANLAFMAAVLAHAGKKPKSKPLFEVPDAMVLRYLAYRCTALAAAGEPVPIAPAARPAAPNEFGIPQLERPGIAPRFPPVKKFLEQYGGVFVDWMYDLQFLAQYAEQGPGFLYDDGSDEPLPYRNHDAFDHVELSAMMLRWNAVQVALGAGVPARVRSKGVAACVKQLAAMKKRKPYLSAEFNEECDVGFCKQLMVEDGFTGPEIEVALLAHPYTMELATEHRQLYATRIVDAAAADEATGDFITRRERAQDELEAYRREIGDDWTIPWRRSVAYRYRSIQMAALDMRSARAARGTLQDYVPAMVHCLLLGWQDWAGDLLQRSHSRVAQGFDILDEKKPDIERRTPLFVLRLIDQWQSREGTAYPRQAFDEPIFENLLAHWRHPDPAAIAPLLLAACDRHTQQAVSKAYSPDFDYHSYSYDPYEILLVLHLRRQLGLANPVLEHPLMATRLGVLPAPAPPFREVLLDGAVARFRKEVAQQAPFTPDPLTFV